MATGEHEVFAVERAEGKLAFTASVGNVESRVWLRAPSGPMPSTDALLPLCLMPAMRFGGSLRLAEPVNPRILRTQREFQAIQRAWSLEWDFGDPPLEEVEVIATTQPPVPAASGRVAAFFSGGVDSWTTILENPDLTDLIFVRGFDLLLDSPRHVELIDEVEGRLRDAAAAIGLPLNVVETNLRQFSDRFVPWDAFYGCALSGVALLLSPLFERVLIAGDSDYEVQVPLGANRLVDQLWSTEQLEIVDDGGRFSRIERLRRIADHPVVQETLRVCWENPGGAYNCGRCRKYLMTMISLEAIGARDGMATFPGGLELSAVADIQINHPVLLTLWEDVLDEVRAARRGDLEPAVEEVVVNGKRSLGLPHEYRRRRRPGPAPVNPRPAPEPDDPLATILQSRSWRLTAPLRGGAAALRRLRERFRRPRSRSG